MPTTTLTRADRHALGINARKQLARSAHCVFDRKSCPHQPLDILHESMRGRLAPLIKLKYERMAASPFGFFRGAVPIMAADLAAHPSTGIITQICGDAHVRNLGAYGAPDGRLVFDINDFDETIRAPFEWDIKRLATSLIVAGRDSGIRRRARHAAVATFTARYRKAMRDFASMPVLELAHFQVHRIAQVAPVIAVLKAAERATPQRSLESLTEPGVSQTVAKTKHAHPAPPVPRRFKSEPPLLQRVTGPEAQLVLDALIPYARTLAPERRHFLAQYHPIDVAFKVVGTGSVGLRDYCIYFEGNAASAFVASTSAATEPGAPPTPSELWGAKGPISDPLFLQLKEEPASAFSAYLPENASGRAHNGHRVADGQRAMQLTSDPFLGYTSIDGRDYLVRQLNDHKASLDLSRLSPDSLCAYADLCGELLARGHARAGDPVAIAAYIGNSSRFDNAILAFARTYANQTETDWKALVKSLKQESKHKGKQNDKPQKPTPPKTN
jgi:uncharacterized protein (DUF2252 family)